MSKSFEEVIVELLNHPVNWVDEKGGRTANTIMLDGAGLGILGNLVMVADISRCHDELKAGFVKRHVELGIPIPEGLFAHIDDERMRVEYETARRGPVSTQQSHITG